MLPMINIEGEQLTVFIRFENCISRPPPFNGSSHKKRGRNSSGRTVLSGQLSKCQSQHVIKSLNM